MIAHHHLDSRRVLRILVLVWILLAILVLLPIHTHGQETLAPPISTELVEEAPVLSLEELNAIAFEVMFLGAASLAFLVFNPYLDQKPKGHKPKLASR